MAKFENLISDIYNMVESPEFELSEDGINTFLQELGDVLRSTFDGGVRNRKEKVAKLVASNYGLPARRLWYTLNVPKTDKKFSAPQRINFLYGSIVELIVLMLAREAGHDVREEQRRVVVNDVSGKTDARIDGVVTDVKSASSFSFRKFADTSFITDDDADPFGYKYQLGLYLVPDNDAKGAFLVVNKENGEMVSVVLDRQMDLPDVHLKIEQDKAIQEMDAPPSEKCYEDLPSGKSGNKILHKLCSFCEFKDVCWADANDGKGLIKHHYASGPVYFTKIVRPPNTKADEEE